MKLPGHRVIAALAVLSLSLPVTVLGEPGAGSGRESPDNTYKMEGVTVTEAPFVSPVTPVTTRYGTQHNLVTEEEIERQNSLDFQSTLRNVPGVMFQSRNLLGSQTSHSLYVRGRGASHPSPDLDVRFDGVPRFGALFGQVLGDGTAVSAIGGIEVYKSPQPSQFGSGYASINILPRQMTKEGRIFELDLGGGTFGTLDQSLSGGYRDGPFDIFLSQSWTSTDGHLDHSRAQQQGYYLNTGYRFGREWELRFLASYVGGQTLAPTPDNVAGVTWPAAERFDTGTTFTTLTLSHRYDRADGFVKAYWNDTDFDLLQELSGGVPYAGGGVSSRQEISLYGVRAKETFRLWEGGELVAGADLDYSDLRNTQRTNSGQAVPGVNGGRVVRVWNFPDIQLFSPYLAASQTTGSRDGLHFIPSAGFRYYAHNEFKDKAAPQAGIVLGHGNTDFSAGYAKGVNYPSPVVVMNLVVDTSTVTDPGRYWSQIKPETADHYEFSVTHTLPGKASLGATYFRDLGKDRFRAYMFGAVPAVWNDPIGEYEIRGLELTGTVTPAQDLELFAALTWLRSEAKGNDGNERTRLPYTPNFQAQAGADWKFLKGCLLHVDMQHLQGVYSSTSFRTQGFNYGDLGEALKLDDSTLVNAKVSRTFDRPEWGMKDSEIYLAVNNLFNDHYEYATGYAMPGITLFGGVKLRFQ